MLTLTPTQRRALKAQAHAQKPVVMIGEAGLSPAVLKEIDLALGSHALIKIKVLSDEREQRAEIFQKMCAALNAAPVQHIGKILVIYRPHPEGENAAPATAKFRKKREPRKNKRSFQS